MSKATQGNVVKFYDIDGKLNGGTIIDIIQKDNVDCALINTLEDRKIIKKLNELTPIKRQQRGRISAKFMDDLKEEIHTENKSIIENVTSTPTSSNDAERTPSTSPILNNDIDNTQPPSSNIVESDNTLLLDTMINKEMIINSQKEEISQLIKRNNDLKVQIEMFLSPQKRIETMTYTIKRLGNALLASTTNDYKEVIKELLKIIEETNFAPIKID